MGMGLLLTLTAKGCALMRTLSRKCQQRVKFPDIWIVYRSFQKQTLNNPSQQFLYSFFMFNFRDPTLILTPTRLKITPFSNPASVNRLQEEPPVVALTNKQSVYGLFLDELLQYYKLLPLELDFNFLKSMRKIHSKGNELATGEHLQKAAQILIQAKNKLIREQIGLYKSQCQEYFRKSPNALSTIITNKSEIKKYSAPKPRKSASRHQFKKILPQHKFFQRVKSQGKQQNFNCVQEKRSSFLLHPQSIRFESSKQIMKRVQYSKQGQVSRFPKITQSNRIITDSIRSSLQKNKHIRVFFSPINRSPASNTDRAVLLRNILFSSKHSETSANSLQKVQSLLVREKQYQREVSIQLDLPKQEEPRKNRKLMLQLLRQKNKQAFLND